jgi:uncharacterized membrane protein YcaP (DUF421 family)
MFGLTGTPGFELFLRTTIIYLGLLAAMRFIARREAGSLELPDLLMIVLIADGVQNGMSGEYSSVTGAAIVGGTILGWNYALTMLMYRSEVAQRLLSPKPLLLVRNGTMVRKNMRREFVTADELMSLLRINDVHDLGEVAVAHLEPDGQLSVRKREGGERRPPHQRKAMAH